MKTLLVIAVMALSASAYADKPTLEEAKTAIRKLKGADAKTAAGMLEKQVWYAGVEADACGKKLRTHGTSDAQTFASCLGTVSWHDALAEDAVWKVVDPKAPPSVFKTHKAKLGKLAKQYLLVTSESNPEERGSHTNLYALVKTGGTVKLHALLISNLFDD